MFRPITALIACLPVAAIANCPTGADLETGIEVAYDDDSFEIYTQFSPDVVEVREGGDEVTWRNLLGRGVYLLQLASLDQGRIEADYTTSITYPVPVGDLPLPKPGGAASYTTVTVDGFLADVSTEVQTHTYGDLTTLTIGACSYAMVPMTVVYDEAGDWSDNYVEEIGFLPELGIGLLLSFREEAEAQPDIYVPVSIRVAGG